MPAHDKLRRVQVDKVKVDKARCVTISMLI